MSRASGLTDKVGLELGRDRRYICWQSQQELGMKGSNICTLGFRGGRFHRV